MYAELILPDQCLVILHTSLPFMLFCLAWLYSFTGFGAIVPLQSWYTLPVGKIGVFLKNMSFIQITSRDLFVLKLLD